MNQKKCAIHYSKIKDMSEGNEKRIRDAKEVRINQGVRIIIKNNVI